MFKVYPSKLLKFPAGLLAFVVLLMQLVPSSAAFAQQETKPDCDKYLQQAQENYYNGEFDKAIELVKVCITQSDLNERQKEKAYKILAQTSLAKGETDTAEKFTIKVLELNPDYQPTIETDHPSFVDMVNRVREKMKKQEIKAENVQTSKPLWVWYGAGGVAVVTAAVILLSRDNSSAKKQDVPLPEPPQWPK